MKNMIQDDQGFTVLEMLVASSILMIGLYAAADAMVINAKFQRTSNSESEINMLFDRVQGIAGSEWSCTAGLAGSDYNGPITVKDPVNSTATVAAEGTTSSQGPFWTLDRVRMQNVQDVTGQAGVHRGSLVIQASKNMRIHLGSPVLTRSVLDIYFETNPDGTIARCYTTSDTVAAAQSACQLLGGTWLIAPAANGVQCQLAAPTPS
jgi:hypothetical protein